MLGKRSKQGKTFFHLLCEYIFQTKKNAHCVKFNIHILFNFITVCSKVKKIYIFSRFYIKLGKINMGIEKIV